MATSDDLPRLPPLAAGFLAALIAVLWVAWRVRILRRREARRDPADTLVPAPRWLAAFAARPTALRELGGLAALLAAGLVWTLLP